VIRGEDLLPSTPRQIEIIHAMGADPPAYAHLPLITGPNGQPLSKRFGSVAVETFREQGYLPEAMVNYLALLGWSYDATTTFFSMPEMVEKFDLSRVSHSPAAFDTQKLAWMNGHYIREASDERLAELLAETAERASLATDPAMLAAAVPLIKERMHTLVEGLDLIRFLFVDEVEPDERARRMLGPERAELLADVIASLEALEPWTATRIHVALEEVQERSGLSKKQAFQPVRAAVTGALVSPPLFESMELLGRERTLERLRSALATVSAEPRAQTEPSDPVEPEPPGGS